ncbi:hypothetical protein [Streptacidiphilus sp. PB12-B1b]|uniref:hypothetical protein n=1 Tax=Streptacidiphilus sp. PB12-B1b TaxID=2705012 RepID=UPI00351A4BB6
MLVTFAVSPVGAVTRPSPVGAVPVPVPLLAEADGDGLAEADCEGEALAEADGEGGADCDGEALADGDGEDEADCDGEADALALGLPDAPPGPVSDTSSALYVPSPYQPWVYTCTEVVNAPVVKLVDSCVQPDVPGVQVLAVTPVPVAPR